VDPSFDRYQQTCRQLGLEVTCEQYGRLVRYAALVREWNRKINLVSRKDTERILGYHVTDSLAVQSLVPAGARVCDVGSGAGLPGIPLAIVRPDATVLLIESIKKRSQFLRHATAELEIANAEVFAARAESLPPLECDVILSRLTGAMEDVLADCARHRRPSGVMVFYKNRESERDLKRAARSLTKLRLKTARLHDVELPGTEITRRFVVIGSA